MWDEIYVGADYLFGTEPADFLLHEALRLPPASRVLCVADGEGRNSTHLAGLGHHVTAMDGSGVAVEKARKLAAARDVSVDFRHADISLWDWRPDAFDAVIAIFIQFAGPALRHTIHKGIASTLRPGGLLLMHGYAPRQVGYGTGGPPDPENMYTLPLLCADFPGWQVLHAADRDAEIHEGRGHSGKSALVDFVALRPALADFAHTG
jgi:SAM-dependent methyltransferase